jgi:hypothetical protein
MTKYYSGTRLIMISYSLDRSVKPLQTLVAAVVLAVSLFVAFN